MLRSLLPLLLTGAACGHGINGHVHVTGWAIESLPPGPLADFLAEPEVFEAALIGASFPDSGYAIDDPYGELAHWPPFVQALLDQLRRGDFDADLEARKTAAFLMGLACHGLQDELFDSIFLHQVSAHDGRGQDEADPGTDGFLVVDGHLRFKPAFFLPGEALVTAFRDAHGHAVSVETMTLGLRRVKLLVIDAAESIGANLDARYRPLLPWTAAHYLDADIPGSLRSEVPATAAYLEAIWARLHGEWPVTALVGHAYPQPPRRLLGIEAASVDSWVTLVFGSGAIVGTVNAETVRFTDASGDAVPFELHHTRWSGSRPDESTRLVQLRPQADLRSDHTYTVELARGVRLQDGRTTDAPWRYTFQTPCAPADPCVEPDAGVADIGVGDAAREIDDAAPDAAPEITSGGDGCSGAPGSPFGSWWLLLGFSAAAGAGSARARRVASATAGRPRPGDAAPAIPPPTYVARS